MSQNKHHKEHEEKHPHKDHEPKPREKEESPSDKHKGEKEHAKKHEAEEREHERLEKAREPVLKEKAHGPEPGPEQVKHVPSREERREKGWGGNVDTPSTKDEDPQKNFTPVLGTEYMEVDSKDLQVQQTTTEEAQKHQREEKDRTSDQVLKDREELLKREGR